MNETHILKKIKEHDFSNLDKKINVKIIEKTILWMNNYFLNILKETKINNMINDFVDIWNKYWKNDSIKMYDSYLSELWNINKSTFKWNKNDDGTYGNVFFYNNYAIKINKNYEWIHTNNNLYWFYWQ